MRRVFKIREFDRWMRKTALTDEALCAAVEEMGSEPVDADSGGGVSKKRVAKPKSRLLGSIHDTARELQDAGFIDVRRMRQYEALCLSPVEPYSREQIVALRARFNISQGVLASLLNTSLSTVRQWEGGLKRPSGPSLKLLNLLSNKGLEALV